MTDKVSTDPKQFHVLPRHASSALDIGVSANGDACLVIGLTEINHAQNTEVLRLNAEGFSDGPIGVAVGTVPSMVQGRVQ